MGAAETTTTTTTPDPKRSAAAKKAAVTRQVNADRAKAKKSRAAATAAQYRSPAVWWGCFREVRGCRCPRGYYCASVGTRYQRNSLNKDHGPPRRVTRHEVQRRTAMREEYRCPGRKAAP